jgi:hypothetical protein
MMGIKVTKELWAVIAAVIVGLFLGLAPWGQNAAAAEFSADQVTVGGNGKLIAKSKMYIGANGARIEYAASEDRGDMVSIFRKDKKLFWMISPAAKKYTEDTFDEKKMKEALNATVGRTVKVLGTEKIQGFTCTKKQVETTVTFLGMKNKSESTVWESDRFDMPLKTQDKNGAVTELRNIKLGRQPARLFEVPAGYTKVANMIALFADGEAGSGSEEESEQEGSFPDIQKGISDKIKNFKWPFNGDQNGETAK